MSELAGVYQWAGEHGGVHTLYLRRVRGGLQTWYRAPGPDDPEAPRRAAAPGAVPLVVPLEVLTWLAMRIWEEASADAVSLDPQHD